MCSCQPPQKCIARTPADLLLLCLLIVRLQVMTDARRRQEADKERGDQRQKGLDRLQGLARIKVGGLGGMGEGLPDVRPGHTLCSKCTLGVPILDLLGIATACSAAKPASNRVHLLMSFVAHQLCSWARTNPSWRCCQM